MEYADIKSHALQTGVTKLAGADLALYEAQSNGCSGALSWVYAIGGKTISCHKCCVAHDYLYDQGGTAKDRKKADKLLRWCAARSGSFPPGIIGNARRVWRHIRAWVMYGFLRACGWWWPGAWAGE